MMWHDGGYGMHWSGWLFMVLVLAGVWTLVFLLIRQVFSNRRPEALSRTPTPLAELDGRLARGEISAEDYATTRRLLTDGH